ncbi:MAG TPA: hypothetical protein VGW10_01980 [Solirubrobacteraceae bacterium]|nr:hypothetical protein [Solirubrobacteraceae bacterium]
MPEKPRASRLEILGAWLHVWTPPRDVHVPPVPWRKVGIGAGVLVVLGVATALVVAPAIDDAKDRGAAERQAAEDRRAAARRARLIEEQRPRRGRLPAEASRIAALRLVQKDIGRDAQQRFGANGRPATCVTLPGADGTARRVVFDCLATVREIRGAGEQEGATGSLAIPYRAALDFEARRYVFCKVNPRPSEAALPDPRDVVEPPAECRR